MTRQRNRVATALATILFGTTQASWAQTLPTFDLPDQSLAASLKAIGSQTNTNVLVAPELVDGRAAPQLKGRMTLDAALTHLLSGTPLRHKFISDGTVVVTVEKPAAAQQKTDTQEASRNGSSGRVRLARMASPEVSASQTAGESAQTSREAGDSMSLEEIIVTAQKRSERLQDVPVAVTALSGEALSATNELRLDNYYSRVPALSLTTGQPFGSSTVSIRGIITGINQSPTVGIVVDDVPYTSSNVRGFGHVVAEVDPSDLQSIEVLRGPQGTLYGAASIGGLIKYVTIDPSTDAMSGRVQAGLSSIQNGDEPGYNIRGSLNVPVSNSFAMRASAFQRRDPGYIDDPVRGAEAVNSEDVTGGRLAALWKPSDNFSLKLSALIQDSEADGNAHVDLLPGFGDLEQTTPPGSEGYRKELHVFSANMAARLGIVELESISAYTSNKNTFRWDYSRRFGSLASASFPGATGATSVQEVNTDKFTQELRLSMPIGERMEWRIGAFYNYEDTPHNDQMLYAVNYSTGAEVGTLANLVVKDKFEEYAVFSDVRFDITDRFDIQMGARASWNEEELLQHNSGILFGGSFPEPLATSKDNSVTYLVTPRFKITPDVMTYARFASGYRPGGPNVGTALSAVVPQEYGPDKTRSYEIGVKADAFDRMLSIDASVYYIDWQDIQLTLRQVLTYIANAAEAKSQGVELSVQLRPTRGLTVSAWGAWGEAELTEDFPLTTVGAIGREGDRLPFSSRFSGNLSVDQEFSLGTIAAGFLGASFSYVGERKSVFTTAPVRATFGSYAKIDLRAGLKIDSWTANLFATNVADERGILSDAFYPNAVTYITPRTIGMAIAKSF